MWQHLFFGIALAITLINRKIQTMKLVSILILCTSCMSGYVKSIVSNDTKKDVYVKIINARWPQGDNTAKLTCSKQTITYRLGYGEFVLNTESDTIRLKETFKIYSQPDLYCGITEKGMYHTLYMYLYRSRIHIQITPIPKGFVADPFQPEKFYIVSSENICEQADTSGTIVQTVDDEN